MQDFVWRQAQAYIDAQKMGPEQTPEILNLKRVLRARISAAERRCAKWLGSHTNDEWNKLVSEVGGQCVRCGVKSNLQKDHIVPTSHWGSDLIENIQPLCGRCNSAKNNFDDTNYLELWRQKNQNRPKNGASTSPVLEEKPAPKS